MRFLVDTGAEVNFIKIQVLNPITVIATHEALSITGITMEPKSSKFILRARTKTSVAINLQNTTLKTGYLPRIKTPDNIFIGEAVGNNLDQKCYVMAVNSYEEDAEVEIPPRELQPFERLEESEDFFDSDKSELK